MTLAYIKIQSELSISGTLIIYKYCEIFREYPSKYLLFQLFGIAPQLEHQWTLLHRTSDRLTCGYDKAVLPNTLDLGIK